jgi:hypothetical protein
MRVTFGRKLKSILEKETLERGKRAKQIKRRSMQVNTVICFTEVRFQRIFHIMGKLQHCSHPRRCTPIITPSNHIDKRAPPRVPRWTDAPGGSHSVQPSLLTKEPSLPSKGLSVSRVLESWLAKSFVLALVPCMGLCSGAC